MNDTHPKIQEIYNTMMSQRTSYERAQMVSSMYETAKKIAISSILASEPNLNEKELKCRLFLHFYENDFSPAERNKILARLQQ